MTTRLNKHIAETGFCSRREADRLIAERRVTVNNLPAGMGAVVGEGDEVKVDGQPLRVRNKRAGGRKHGEEGRGGHHPAIMDIAAAECRREWRGNHAGILSGESEQVAGRYP